MLYFKQSSEDLRAILQYLFDKNIDHYIIIILIMQLKYMY